MKQFGKYLFSALIFAAMFLAFNTPAHGKNAGANDASSYIAFDFKRVRFPHEKHKQITKQGNASCQTCHHRQKNGRAPIACGACHARRTVTSKGEYARYGQELRQKDVYHLLCWQCHKKMSQIGYKRPDGSSGNIPSKCHHCHLAKNDSRLSMAF